MDIAFTHPAGVPGGDGGGPPGVFASLDPRLMSATPIGVGAVKTGRIRGPRPGRPRLGPAIVRNWLNGGRHRGIPAAVSVVQKTTCRERGGFAKHRVDLPRLLVRVD